MIKFAAMLLLLPLAGCSLFQSDEPELPRETPDHGFYRLNSIGFPIYCVSDDLCIEPSEAEQRRIIDDLVKSATTPI